MSGYDTQPREAALLAEYQAAAEAGILLLRACQSCGEAHVYPRPHCPLCGHRGTEWREASGAATLYSYTTSALLPPATHYAMVTLAEGPTMPTILVQSDFEALEIGQPLTLRFTKGPKGAPVPAFVAPASLRAEAYAARVIAEAEAVPPGEAPALAQVAVIGGGTMGQGIVSACLIAGLSAVLVDRAPEALERARSVIAANVAQAIEKGKARPEAAACLDALVCTTDMAAIARADVVIEAVYEAMALKQEVMAQANRFARPGAVLGTNTSTLDIDAIARATTRPGAVVGLHFFSPAHIMKLLEIVRGTATEPATLAAARALGDRLRKTSVTVGNAFGFVGNRLMIAREHHAAQLLLAGALPQEVDAFQTGFGLPMGTFTLQDMAGGIELAYRQRQDTGRTDWLIDRLFKAGRTGLKSGKGYYRYEPGSRKPIPDPEVEALIRAWSAAEGVTRRPIPPAEMHDRLILPMLNEGFKLLEEGIADRPEDIDTVWLRGYGWPARRGGPMYYAQQRGLGAILDRLTALQAQEGEAFRPAALLQSMVAEGRALFAPSPDAA